MKEAWIEFAKCPCVTTDYAPNVENWTCKCGGQQLQAHHFFKHLTQAVEGAAPRRPNLFETLTCRHVMPLQVPSPLDVGGSISDGDDDFWME